MKRIYLASFFLLLFLMGKAQDDTAFHLIPQPAKISRTKGWMSIDKNTNFLPATITEHAPLITHFQEQLANLLSGSVRTPKNTSSTKTHISFLIAPNLPTEAYRISINKKGATFFASSAEGWFYGWQTFVQMLQQNFHQGIYQLPAMEIYDEPKLKWRGLMVDVSRHFFSKEVLKRYIDQMAKYKFNVLHLHLTDNQGWRIEVKQLPKLTAVGAWRVPRTGYWSGMPAPEPNEVASDGGFYSQEDIKELVNYAKMRFVDIVPEIDLPGHSLALIAAYPEMSCTKTPQKVLAGDPWNPTRTNVVCVGNDSTYVKIAQIIDEVASIFPSKYIHIGGDEVSRDYWAKCPVCQQRMATENLKTVDELQSYFINRVAKMVTAKGKTPIGWYETLEKGLDNNIVQMSWKDEKGAIKSSAEGKKVILTPAFLTYLDFYQGDPLFENAPFTVNRLSNTYRFNPLPQGIVTENVLGGQGSLWTEQVPNERKLQHMTWPRAFALSENLWAAAPKASWPTFLNRIESHLKWLDQNNVNYSRQFYEPMVNAKRNNNGQIELVIDVEKSGLSVYYSFDDTDPDPFYPKYSTPLSIPKGAKTIRVVSYDKQLQKGRILKFPIAELLRRAKL